MANFIKDASRVDGKAYILDSPTQQEQLLQFVPATVNHIINSKESSANVSNNHNESNCVIVEPNIFTDEVSLNGMDTRKYRPLMRGISDSVVKGDSVLITQVGNVGYYLGPLNTSNTPSSTDNTNATKNTNKVSSKTYPYNAKFGRLVKEFNVDLDDPDSKNKRIKSPKTGKDILGEIHTDMILEGRHGNSIRLGSRNRFPNMIIDNGRNSNQPFESINDSSLFGMFSQGTILQHFNPENEFLDGDPYTFKLGDESIDTPTKFIKSTFTSPLGRGQAIEGEVDGDIETTIYGYEHAFSILNSDRIIINARKENIFLSAFNHIHIGAGNSLTFSTSENTLFESQKRFDINAPEIRLGSAIDEETEPIVLGDKLVAKLTELCDQLDQLINNITAITVPTTQGPSGTPINGPAFAAQTQGISEIASSLDEILSKTNRTT